ncbi:autotransporter outer membrane beta-barrel domain-containing protein [uncultured Dialister sp.]|uniref:autotransporter outer membrane beta-barrel domain-containing protein n=1 Tax=uncultured Dialister sp. TaxID=278064 RepID=UPI0025E40A20|nr:autotransporter outer membrane beta-barrel domain-containing protein [uncultured Dialister sp.]
MPVEAAERTTPLVVTEKDQTIHDDFGTASQPVSITDGKTPAVLEIASSAADKDGVTTVYSNIINGTFTVGGSKDNVAEANGIWVQDNYPGTVRLANGLNVKVDAAGNYYNTSGIYLEGVDRSHYPKSTDESVNANEEYKNNGNQISSTTVNVGSGTTITVNAKAPEGKTGTFVNSVALENHFGHMNVGDNVHLNLTTGAFQENDSAGFYQLYYGDTSIGNGFTSTVTATTGNSSQHVIVHAVHSNHDHPLDHQIHAITQNKLHIGDDAVLTAQVHDQTQGDYTENGSIDETGAFLSRTDFIIGDRMKVDTEQTGVPGRKGYGINESTIITGIYTRAAKGSIGSDLMNTVKVKNRNMQMVAGMRFSGWLQNGDERPENPSDDTSIVSVGARNMNKIDVEDSIARHLVGIIADSDSNINIGQDCQIHMYINQSQVSGYTYGIYAGAGGSNSTIHFGPYGTLSLKQDGGTSDQTIGICTAANSTIDLGPHGTLSLMQYGGTSNQTYGIYAVSDSKIDFGPYGTLSLEQVGGTSNQTIGICTDPNSTIHFGSYGTVSLKQEGGTSKNGMFGIYADANTKINFGPHGTLSLMQDGGISNKTYGIYAVSDSKIDFGPYGTLSLAQDRGTSNGTYGIYADANKTIDFGPHGTINLMQDGGTSNQTMGIYAVSGSKIDFGPYGTVSLQFEGDYQGNSQILSDLWNYGADTEVKDHASFTVSGNLTKAVPQAITQIRGIYVGNGTGRFGGNLTVHTSGHNYAMVSGIVASADTEKTNLLSDGDNAHVTVDATEDETGTTNKLSGGNYIAGIKNSGKGSFVTVGRNAQIQVSAPEDKEVSALWVYKNAKMEMGDGAVLTVNSAAAENNNVVKADSVGKVTFDGGMTLSGSQNAIYSTGDGSSVTALGAGRKVILGNLESADKGSIKLKLNTADSLLRGKSTIDGFRPDAATTHGLMAATAEVNDASGNASGDNMPADTELTVANGARWDMTDNSQVKTLNHENGGTVNMSYNPELQRLDVDTYNGNGGVFRMKSDLNQLETDDKKYADKVYIQNAEVGSTGLIQVHDQSFLTGHEVTGTKYQLLITDKSGKAKFSGMDLDDGGLWDVTPTIQNGKYVHDVMNVSDANEEQWYLTKLERKINKDTIPLMKAADNSYALYRLDIDSLRKRMGDLRFRNLKDTSGLWARDFHGAYDGSGVDSKYNGFQLGYDYAANDKSVYGFFAERTISNPKYSYGSSKDHGLSGGLYGTWLGDSGVYTDVVAKWGRDDTNLHTWGGWPDSANYRTWNESLSVEWGKTFTRDDGLFLEPEAQMVFGRLGSKDYTTRRGRTVSMGSYDSAIGRLGILLGKRVTDREHPYDYYLKFSMLHEFGGERNFHLAAPDGETYDYSEDYRDTWYEAGFGGTWHINGNTSLYADAERSFGGMWHKKWQWNVGVNWQF